MTKNAKRIDRIIIATRNPAKKKRYKRLLVKIADKVSGLDELNTADRPEETGKTAEENAEIKARFYVSKFCLTAFAEDEALYVDFLPKNLQPGVHVRRIEGKDEASDKKLLAYWEKIVASVPADRRTGYWHVAYCLAFPDGRIKTFSLDRRVVFFSPSSKIIIPGWPMSSLEGSVTFGKPDSELTKEERKQLHQKYDKIILKKLGKFFSEV